MFEAIVSVLELLVIVLPDLIMDSLYSRVRHSEKTGLLQAKDDGV